uniref:Putative secreted protein n=1 Tax=Anopheles marajoara TaxID=58244 RepID=A0A2M4CE00_9DIPT
MMMMRLLLLLVLRSTESSRSSTSRVAKGKSRFSGVCFSDSIPTDFPFFGIANWCGLSERESERGFGMVSDFG